MATSVQPPGRRSTRQPRNSTRPTNYYARPFPRHASEQVSSGDAYSTQPGFFPALTHFTDSVTALPIEIIKHFSMLREVEAKAHAPDTDLQDLSQAILRLPAPPARPYDQMEYQLNPMMTLSAQNSVSGSVAGSASVPGSFADGSQIQPTDDIESDRRHQFLRMRRVLQSMAMILDEKNAVLTTANQSLSKQISRMESSYTHIDEEISPEARYGSTTHWAYIDKEPAKKPTASERTRRDVASANSLAAAAAAVHEGEIASRSGARREAMMAKKHHRSHQNDSDFEDRTVRKSNTGNRNRQSAADPDSKAYNANTTNGQGTKRRKTEKAAATGMERSMSQALAAANAGGSGRGQSPRRTPATDGPKQKKNKIAPASLPKKKTQTSAAHSPSAPSPAQYTFGKDITSAPQRPQSSRGRQNSATNSNQSNAPDSRNRPGSSTAPRPAPLQHLTSQDDTSAPPRSATFAKDGQGVDDTGRVPPAPPTPFATSHSLKREETPAGEQEHPIPAAVVTRAGRTSKTATPIAANFPEVPMARSRSTRNKNEGGGSYASSESGATGPAGNQKRSNKRGTQTTQSKKRTGDQVGSQDNSDTGINADGNDEVAEIEEVDEDDDGEEQRYCYCHGVSYGDMVACDNEDCPREWFHLSCVGLSRAPSSKSTWYCDDCKENMRKARPASRHT